MHPRQFKYLSLFWLVLAFSCTTKTSDENSKEILTTDTTLVQEVEEVADTTSNYLGLADTILDQIQNVTSWTVSSGSIKVSEIKLRGALTEVLYTINDGVSTTKYVMTFLNGRYVDHEALDRNSDMDLSYASYKSRQLRDEDGYWFLVVSYLESVVDSNLLDPTNKSWLKSGYSFDEVVTHTDSTTIKLTVKLDGQIIRDTLMHYP